MKDIRIFVASSKELIAERNQLAFLVLSMEEEMTEERTEDRYLEEMYDSDAALVLFKTLIGKYTREETEKALERERGGYARLKAHRILFKEGDGAPTPELAAWRAELKEGEYGVFTDFAGLKAGLLALVDRLVELDASGEAGKRLLDAPPDAHVRRITAFLAADDELAADRDAFADTVLNLNDLLEFRNLRVQLRFCPPGLGRDALRELVSASEMGLVLYGTNVRAFGREEMDDATERTRRGENPKKLYVFFRDDGGRELSEEFVRFRDSFVERLGHFVCQFGGADSLRLSFLLSLERYAGETVEIYSTVSAPTAPTFVGREAELRRLADLLAPTRAFPAGRLPVVTGAGGTGKSELVRQFASQLRVQYPGGVFQVDMETCRTWDDAFLGILKGTPNNGIKVEECLGLEGSGEDGDSKDSSPLDGAAVRDALLKRSRSAGPVLLVLDNVEGCEELLGEDDAFAKAFPSGFSERVSVNVVATARTCDVPLREDGWAQAFPLGDLSPEAALELLFADRKADTEEEAKAAKRVAELLGRRALFLRRVPAILKGVNKKARIVCRTYAKLAEALERDALGTINKTGTVDQSYWPSRLWEIVQGNLAEWGLLARRLPEAAPAPSLGRARLSGARRLGRPGGGLRPGRRPREELQPLPVRRPRAHPPPRPRGDSPDGEGGARAGGCYRQVPCLLRTSPQGGLGVSLRTREDTRPRARCTGRGRGLLALRPAQPSRPRRRLPMGEAGGYGLVETSQRTAAVCRSLPVGEVGWRELVLASPQISSFFRSLCVGKTERRRLVPTPLRSSSVRGTLYMG